MRRAPRRGRCSRLYVAVHRLCEQDVTVCGQTAPVSEGRDADASALGLCVLERGWCVSAHVAHTYPSTRARIEGNVRARVGVRGPVW